MGQTQSYWNEVTAAARGVAGLVVGDRTAPTRFDLTPRGLAGSLIALLVVIAAGAVLPAALGQPVTVLRDMAEYVILFALQVACSAVMLRQVNRMDGFVPYLVADNWSSVFLTVGATALDLLGVPDALTSVPLALLVLVVAINIGRLVVTLPPLQVAMFVIAQLVGALLGAFTASLLIPPLPAAVG